MGTKVGIFDEHEIFALGVESVLREDSSVVGITRHIDDAPDVDVAVTSFAFVAHDLIRCPVIVCVPARKIPAPLEQHGNVFAQLPRETVTPDQLRSAVHAALAGLRILSGHVVSDGLDDRSRSVLRLLAAGADTREISNELGYSERTIKGTIQQIERSLGARSRAQAVALALRSSLI